MLIFMPRFFSCDSRWQTGPRSHSVYLTVSVPFFLFSFFKMYLFSFPPQSTRWRWQIRFQHFTANQIKDQLHWSRQVLLAVWAGMSIQMSPHRHHLARLFTGQWWDKSHRRPPSACTSVTLWQRTVCWALPLLYLWMSLKKNKFF